VATFGEGLKTSIEVVAYLATIGAIAFAVQQYRATEADNRVNATLSYVGRFNSDPALQSFKRLDDAWYSNAEQGESHDPTKSQIQFIENNNLKWDAILLGDFFDQLYVCVNRDICDQNLAITMLGRDIETVYVLTGRYLTSLTYTGCGLKALYEVAHPRLKFSRLKPEEQQGKPRPNPALRPDACPTI